jgi:hypothetical protein
MTALPAKILGAGDRKKYAWQKGADEPAMAPTSPIDAAIVPDTAAAEPAADDTPPKTNGAAHHLEPDREQIATFVRALFKHAAPGAYVSLRSFYDDDSTRSFEIQCVAVDNRDDIIERAYHQAQRAANAKPKIVFCPPTATFSNTKYAGKKDVADGLELSAECDEKPQAARVILEKLLGPATLVIASGGEWLNPETGAPEPKLHLHWLLKKPARGGDRDFLEEARKLVIKIVGSDPSHAPISHPIRWPGSLHRKGEPKPCRIVAENPEHEIDLSAALAVLKKAAPAANDNPDTEHDSQAAPNWGELIGAVHSSESYHEPITRLAAKLLAAGMNDGAVVNLMRGWMGAAVGPRDDRWQARFDDIPRAVDTAVEKYGAPVIAASPLRSYFAEELERQAVEPVTSAFAMPTFPGASKSRRLTARTPCWRCLILRAESLSRRRCISKSNEWSRTLSPRW